jgi:hypothetical protein
VELALCHHFGAWNFVVASRFLENWCAPASKILRLIVTDIQTPA